MADDPPLTAAGRERAQELARLVDVLSSAIPLKAIFATEFRRTQQTAAPTSEHSRIRVTVVPAAAQRDLVRKVLAVPFLNLGRVRGSAACSTSSRWGEVAREAGG